MSKRGFKNVWLAFWVSRIMSRGKPRLSSEDLRKADFSASTQRLGLRFTDRIRNNFRFRWLRRR